MISTSRRPTQPVPNDAWGEWPVSTESIRTVLFALLIAALGVPATRAQDQDKEAEPRAKAEELPPPPPIPPFQLAPTLPTMTVPHGQPLYNVQMVDASLLPRDKEGIWVL